MNNSDYKQLLKTIAFNVKKFREEKNLSQFDLALEAECSRNQISRLENCEVNPTLFLLSKIAKALNKSILQLLNQN